MNLLLIVLAAIVALVAVVLLLAANKPDIFALQRSASIHAPPENIFPLINDLRAHESWSPFDKPDPKTKKTHSGAAAGEGAVYEWEGKGEAGAGRIAIAESSPSSRIVMQLDMLKPIKASNTVVFTLQPKGPNTEVTWAMQGRTPFAAKIFHVFCNMDRMLGKTFEDGLANLGTLAERR